MDINQKLFLKRGLEGTLLSGFFFFSYVLVIIVIKRLPLR